MRFKAIAVSGVAVVVLVVSGFIVFDKPASTAPITGTSISDMMGDGAQQLSDRPAISQSHATQVALGYTDKILVNVHDCTIISDSTHNASTVVAVDNSKSEYDGRLITEHICRVEWPLYLSTVGWSAADITHAPAPVPYYGVVTCGHPLDDDLSYNPCTDPNASPRAIEEDGGVMTVLLFNSMDLAATTPIPDAMFPPTYITVVTPERARF